MTKPRPRTGEKRLSRQPLKIDLLPVDVRNAIKLLYDRGETWLEIEKRSALPFSPDWEKNGGGFINWESLDLRVLEEFPLMRLPDSTLQRWFDLRVAQARAQVLVESEKARQWAAVFATKELPESNAAVINALRDLIFNSMQDGSQGDREKLAEGLKDLTLAMSRMQRVELQARRVAVEEKTIQMKLDLVKKKAGNLIGDIEGREGKPPVQLTREELLEKVREIYGAV